MGIVQPKKDMIVRREGEREREREGRREGEGGSQVGLMP